MYKIILKLNLIHLLSESKNYRNDGWCQQGYRKKYNQRPEVKERKREKYKNNPITKAIKGIKGF